MRYRPTPTFADPFTDAARSLLLIDTLVWPAAWRHHLPDQYYAPSLDVVAWFHRAAPQSEWLFCDAQSPIGHGGLIAGSVRVWDQSGHLIASGGQQLICVSTRAYGG